MVKKYEHSHLISQAKTGAGRRAVAARMPQIIETPKTLLLLRGHTTSSTGVSLLSDLQTIKKPYCRKLVKKNDLLPFESGGEAHLENLCRLNDASLFALTNHTKKRPHNLILGRMFDHRLLDMVELGVKVYKPMATYPPPKFPPGCPNIITFNGADFEASEELRTLRSILIDVFRFPTETSLSAFEPASVQRTLAFTLKGESLLLRQYSIETDRQPGANKHLAKLVECGPSVDFVIRRAQNASPNLWKVATHKPKDPAHVPKKKNISRDDLGDKMGRIHVGRQDLSTLALARMKGLGKKRKANGEAPGDDQKTSPTGPPGQNTDNEESPELDSPVNGSSVSGGENEPDNFDEHEEIEAHDPPSKRAKT